MFGLYKKSQRPLLNINSPKGEIAIEFEHEGLYHCVHRQLSKSKVKESVKSSYRTSTTKTDRNNEPLISKSEVNRFSVPDHYQLVEFKNESDLQAILDSILPNREVLLGTYFLMQDSKNIFELPPAERLAILKTIFDLLGIDQNKEKIQERKREVSREIKQRSDTSSYDTKLQQTLTAITKIRPDLTEIGRAYHVNDRRHEWSSLISDITIIGEKIRIESLTIPDHFDQETIIQQLHQLEEHVITAKTTIDLTKQSLNEQAKTQSNLDQQSKRIQDEINILKQKIKSQPTISTDHLQAEIHNLETKQEQLWSTSEAERITSQLRTIPFAQDLVPIQESPLSLSQVYTTINNLITLGKEIRSKLDLHTQNLTHKQEQVRNLDEQLQTIQTKKTQFQTHVSEQTLFVCDKIDGPCPYVNMINTSLQNKHQQQLDNFDQEYKMIESKREILFNDIRTLQNDNTIQTISIQLEQLKTLFKTIDHQSYTTRYTEREQGEQSLQQAKNRYQQALSQQVQLLKDQQQLISLQSQYDQLQQQQQQSQQNYEQLKKQYEKHSKEFTNLPSLDTLKLQKQTIQTMSELSQKLNDLVTDYKQDLIIIKQLQQQEKILSELATIFSKELILLVIQSNLPKIQDLINAYLAQTVDYTVQMEIDQKSETNSDLELFVTIIDRHGERKIESLS